MFLSKTALVLLLNAYSCLRATSQTTSAGGDCFDFADIAFVVDVSGSIEGDGMFPGKFDQYIKPFLKNFVMDLDVGPGKVQIGMVTFGNAATLQFPLLSNKDEINKNIDRFEYDRNGQNTNTSGGINVMRTQLLSSKDPNYRQKAAHIAVVVTDGYSTRDPEQTVPSAKAAQEDGILILVVGVTTSVRLSELIDIATKLTPFNISALESGIKDGVFTPSGTVAYVPEITDLVVVVNQLVKYFKDTVCNATENCPGGDKAEWCSNVQLTCSNITVKTTCCKSCGEGTSRICNDYADVVFVVDVSGSIGKDRDDPDYFDRQIKPFLKSFVQSLNVGPGKIQVGAVTFGNYGYLQFTLSSSVNDIMKGIDNIVYPANGENTNTSGGIYVMRTQVLGTNSPNYRPDASHLCIIVTDGKSTWDHEKTVPYATDAKTQGIVIFSIGCTPVINVQELVGMASILPGLNATVLEGAMANNISGFSGAVAYSPTIEDLKKIVLQFSKYMEQTDCKQAVRDFLSIK